ncbi:CocE/NonD family hydrolase [Clavibacter michiganensis]|uniref:CocE/NonD family hydrolase n=2 Tax=Clavibacter michiganensis TaxID=28447 RepID=UPI001365B05B|nr:CocE/NonD family hydrolase [Clavibacter michiganensis]MDO4019449.1 CocE/NonD family hydrolase [Clavibacter michiganensis]MDO4038898.1 CocE/NonD family hydrolase [Clavibacter michiganensis]MDO4051330.1 CocE/NonD family hydrolase [Clavibacter michiganensis]MDO4063881.1 CocE/NonD family hydrolase [Clavibacter michiganensis]MDO4084681.1 CocE/NonD family hydrolase [Clavibacter michiganensis]
MTDAAHETTANATETGDAVTHRDVWIPMPDGTPLHARVWAPATDEPVPALLEYLPYRLDDWTAPRDSERHPWYAAHGYASIRVDIRGTGSSDGLFVDEYSAQELDDGVAVIEWIAAQAWCTGAVGVFGISWGGFNGLQLAARAPEALKAVVTVCSTDDRFDNDVHYMGGAVLGIDMAAWGATMFAFNSRPPRPEVVGDCWVGRWRERLEANRPMTPTWLAHQERDDYWRHGSVCEDYSSIDAAVLAVGGWADPYRDAVLRLVENLPGPAKGIVGPWSHQYPDRGLAPGPSIGFLQETLRWWDRWLKGVDTGVEADPALRAFLSDSEPPATSYPERTGRWVAAESWPPPASVAAQPVLPLAAFHGPAAAGDAVVIRSPQRTGLDAGRFFPFGNPTDLPPDQRAEDGLSVCFDLLLEEPLDVLGNVLVDLAVTSDLPDANLVVRLCDVAPDGSSTLVTRGALNLNTRIDRARIDPMVPGEEETVRVPLVSTGHAFPAGHRLRIAVSSAYWPWIWPHAREATLVVAPSRSSVTLPVWTRTEDDGVRFEEAVQATPIAIQRIPDDSGLPERSVTHDVATGEWTLDVDPGYGGSRIYPDGLVFTESSRETYRITDGDPTSAVAESRWAIGLEQPTWRARLETTSRVTADADAFRVVNTLRAWARDGGPGAPEVLVADRVFDDLVPRTSA